MEHHSRSPHGERGLKFTLTHGSSTLPWSLPTRGAWIEIVSLLPASPYDLVAPHTGSVD